MAKNDKAAEQPVAGADVEKAVAEIEALPKHIDLALKTLRGDVRDYILGAVKAMPKPFTAMSEFEQRDIASAYDALASRIVNSAAAVMAADGCKSVQGTLQSVNIADGLKITVKAALAHDSVDLLGGLIGQPILLVKPDGKKADGQRGPAKILKDQPDLIPADDNDLLGESGDADADAEWDEAAPKDGEAEAPLSDPAAEADAALAPEGQEAD